MASVRYFVTSRLPTRGHGQGVEASGSSKHPAIPKFKFGGSFMAGDGGAEEVKKTTFVHHKEEQKGKLFMDPIVESSWKSTNYSAPAKESISLVGKFMGMPSAISRGFAPQAAGVGQMKLEAPQRYSGKRQIGIRVWLTVTPPPSGAVSPSTWAERDAVPQIKDYIIDL